MFKLTRMVAVIAAMASPMACVSLASAADDVMFSTGGYARGGQGLRTMKVMKAMDKDGDHMLSQDEFMKMHEAMFAKMDKDHDGMISADEWTDKHVSNPTMSDGGKDHGDNDRRGAAGKTRQ